LIKTILAFALILSATECVYQQARDDFVAPQTKYDYVSPALMAIEN